MCFVLVLICCASRKAFMNYWYCSMIKVFLIWQKNCIHARKHETTRQDHSKISKSKKWQWIIVVERCRFFDQDLQNSEHRIHVHARVLNFFDEVKFHKEYWKANHSQNLSNQSKERTNSIVSIDLFKDDRKLVYCWTKLSIAISELQFQKKIQCWRRIHQHVNMIR